MSTEHLGAGLSGWPVLLGRVGGNLLPPLVSQLLAPGRESLVLPTSMSCRRQVLGSLGPCPLSWDSGGGPTWRSVKQQEWKHGSARLETSLPRDPILKTDPTVSTKQADGRREPESAASSVKPWAPLLLLWELSGVLCTLPSALALLHEKAGFSTRPPKACA